MNRSIYVVFSLALVYPALAQVNPQFADVSDEIEMVRSLVRMERKALVEEAMELAPAESQAFWSVYNEYEAERAQNRRPHSEGRYRLCRGLSGGRRCARRSAARRGLRRRLRPPGPEKEIRAAFRQGSGAHSRSAILQIERKLDAVQNLSIVEEIPLIRQ